METKHTKGEWKGVNHPASKNLFRIQGDGLLIASTSNMNGEANAKLIAAAPDLLEFAIEMVKRYPNSPWIYEQGNKAIKKATE